MEIAPRRCGIVCRPILFGAVGVLLVLGSSNAALSAPSPTKAGKPSTTATGASLTASIGADKRLSTITGVIKGIGGDQTVGSLGKLVLFLPDDDAFKAAGDTVKPWLVAQENTAVFLGAHAILNDERSLDSMIAKPPTSYIQTPFKLAKTARGYTVNNAQILDGPFVTAQATYYVISKVFLPPEQMLSTPMPTPVPLRFSSTTDSKAPRQPSRFGELAGIDPKVFKLDSVLAGAKSDQERVIRMTKWAHDQFPHDGTHNEPTKSATEVLAGAAKGQQFACTEFGKVVSSALNSVGIPARWLGLRTSDVETRPISAGHVLAEAYLRDEKRWIMIDAQFDAIPTVKGKTVNAVELQKAIVAKDPTLVITTKSANEYKDSPGGIQSSWLDFVSPYLHYFEVPLLPDYWNTATKDKAIAAKQLTYMDLIPLGERKPTKFQGQTVSNSDLVYATSSLAVFYAAPPLS